MLYLRVEGTTAASDPGIRAINRAHRCDAPICPPVSVHTASQGSNIAATRSGEP
jgi:hypothetical protein